MSQKDIKIDNHPDYQVVVQELTEWCTKVCTELLETVTPKITIGFMVEDGQQFKIGFKSERLDHVIIRAFVPEKGYPVVLTSCGNEYRIQSHEELLKFLYEDLAKDEDLMGQLRGLYAILHCEKKLKKFLTPSITRYRMST